MIGNRWSLVEVKLGIANLYNDHVVRNHSMSINNNVIEDIARLAVNNTLDAQSIQKTSSRASGLDYAPGSRAYIEDSGWSMQSRGLCSIKLVCPNEFQNNEMQCVVIGYIAGGIVANGEFPMDARFIPVKTYMSTLTVTQGMGGLLTSIKNLRSINQCELSNPYNRNNSYVTRPSDILTTGVSAAMIDKKYESMSGFENLEMDDVLVTSSQLGINKIIMSKYDNANASSFTNNLISSGIRMRSEMTEFMNDEITSYDNALSYANVLEDAVIDNPFFSLMSRIYTTPPEEGYPFFEIADVFPTFDTPGVLNTNLISSNSFESTDNTLTSDKFGSASISETLATELAFIMTDAMLKYRLANIHLSGTNSPDANYNPDYEIIPNTGIFMIGTNAMPLLDGENDVFALQMKVIEKVAVDFYYKYTIRPNGETLPFNIEVDCNIYSDINITIIERGDQLEKVTTYSFGFFADNRFSPVYSESTVSGNKLRNFHSCINEIMKL